MTGNLERGRRMVALSRQLGDKEMEFMTRELYVVALWVMCDRAAVDVEVEAMAALADELRQAAHRWALATCRTVLALMEGRFEEAGQLLTATAGLAWPSATRPLPSRAGSGIRGRSSTRWPAIGWPPRGLK